MSTVYPVVLVSVVVKADVNSSPTWYGSDV